MREIWEIFSDQNEILELEPEELGVKLLFVLKSRKTSRESFSPRNEFLSGSTRGDDTRGTKGCPVDCIDQIRLALGEAFSWLERSGLIIREPAGDGVWYVFTRRALGFDNEDELLSYTQAQTLPKTVLHPKLQSSVWISFVRREFPTAVFQAMREVEISVREAADFPVQKHGVSMIREAFNPKSPGPLVDPEQPESEAEALMHLFAGAIGSYKNPHSHRQVELNNPEEAAEIIMIASHLLKITDARRNLTK